MDTSEGRPTPAESPTDQQSILASRLARMRMEARSASRPPTEYEEELFVVTSGMGRRRWDARYLVAAVLAMGVLGVGIGLFMISRGGDSGTPASQGSDQQGPAATEPPKGEELLGGSTPEPTKTRTRAAGPTVTATPTTSAEGAIQSQNVAVGEAPSREDLRLSTPLRGGSRVLELFGEPRGEGFVHAGVDLTTLDSGSKDVVAACSGVVAGSDRTPTYRQFVVVDCGGGLRTVYANMASIDVEAAGSPTAGCTSSCG
jgi:hypothetical protein